MTKEARLWGGGRGQDPDQNSSALNNTKATPSREKSEEGERGRGWRGVAGRGVAGNGLGGVRGRPRQSS